MSKKRPTLTLGEEVLADTSLDFGEEVELELSTPVKKPVEKPKKASKSTKSTIEPAHVAEPLELLEEEVSMEELVMATGGMTGAELDDLDGLITDIDEGLNYLRMLVYGRTGSGKTMFCGTAENVLLIMTDKTGATTLRNMKVKGKKAVLRDWNDIEKLYWWLKKGGHGIETVAIDHMTGLQQIALRHECLGGLSSSVDKDVIFPTQRDYGNMTQRVFHWVSAFMDLPVHIILTAQERTSSDDADVANYAAFPYMSQSLRNLVLAQMDIVGRMSIEEDESGEVQFLFSAHPSATFWTKDRLSLFKKPVKNPNFSTILKIFKKGGK